MGTSSPSRIDLSADFIKARTCRDARQKGRTDVGYRADFSFRMIRLQFRGKRNEKRTKRKGIRRNGTETKSFLRTSSVWENRIWEEGYSSLPWICISIIVIQICEKKDRFSILQFQFLLESCPFLTVLRYSYYISVHPSKYALMNHTHAPLHACFPYPS